MNITDNRIEIWPGSPRNFADEPAIWYDFTAAFNAIGVDDFLLEIQFTLDPCINKNVFYQSGATGLGVYRGSVAANYNFYLAANALLLNSSGGDVGNSIAVNLGSASDTLSGDFVASIQRIGTSVQLFFGGVLIREAVGASAKPTNLLANLASAHTGTLPGICLQNLTTGQTIWSYPSESERLRLVTYTNIRTDRGVFEAANTSLSWSIKTAVPAGLTGTVLAKINDSIVCDPSHWNRATATFTGAGTDTMDWLMVFYDTLSADQIAYLSN